VLLAPLLASLAFTSASIDDRTHDLYGWAFFTGHPAAGMSAQRFDGRLLTHVRAGRYRVHVKAVDVMPFRLLGPGVTRSTATGASRGYTIYTTWNVRLRRGRYRYFAAGAYAREIFAHGGRITGSFVVR
jgi:hypothetical protein